MGGVCKNTRIRDATKYPPKHQNIQSRPFGTPCRDALHTNSHTITHKLTQLHTKKYFSTKIHTNTNIPHTYTHRVRQHSTFSGGTTQAITYKYIYIYIYIYSQRHRKNSTLNHHNRHHTLTSTTTVHHT